MFSTDISTYTGTINWNLAGPVMDLAIARATIFGKIDDQFRNNWAALKARPNILRGAYQFEYMSEDPVKAVELFLNTVQPQPDELVALDLEDQETTVAINGKGTGALQPIVKKTLDLLEAGIGRKPFIYTSPGWWNYYLCKVVPGVSITPPDWTSDYPLWVAHYTTANAPQIPIGFKTWLIWQYGQETVPGCGITVGSNPKTDCNRLSLSIQALRDFWHPTVVPPVNTGVTLEQVQALLQPLNDRLTSLDSRYTVLKGSIDALIKENADLDAWLDRLSTVANNLTANLNTTNSKIDDVNTTLGAKIQALFDKFAAIVKALQQ